MYNPKVVVGALDQVHHRYSVEIAREQGYFKEEGLNDVEIILAHQDDGLGKLLAAGKLDLMLDVRPQSVLLWIAKQELEAYFVAGFRNRMGGQLFAARDITRLADLKGRRIGVVSVAPRVSLDTHQARILLRRAGMLPETDVVWVSGGMAFNADVGEPQAALRRGEIDCCFVSDSNAKSLLAEGYNALMKNFSEIYPDGYPDRTVVASGDFIRRQPSTVVALLKGIIRAYRFIRDMPKNLGYINDLDRRMRAEDMNPDERLLDPNWTVEKLVSLPFPPDGRLPLKGLEAIMNQEKEVGNIPQSLSASQVCRPDFADEASRQLGSRADLQPELERVRQWVQRYGC